MKTCGTIFWTIVDCNVILYDAIGTQTKHSNLKFGLVWFGLDDTTLSYYPVSGWQEWVAGCQEMLLQQTSLQPWQRATVLFSLFDRLVKPQSNGGAEAAAGAEVPSAWVHQQLYLAAGLQGELLQDYE